MRADHTLPEPVPALLLELDVNTQATAAMAAPSLVAANSKCPAGALKSNEVSSRFHCSVAGHTGLAATKLGCTGLYAVTAAAAGSDVPQGPTAVLECYYHKPSMLLTLGPAALLLLTGLPDHLPQLQPSVWVHPAISHAEQKLSSWSVTKLKAWAGPKTQLLCAQWTVSSHLTPLQCAGLQLPWDKQVHCGVLRAARFSAAICNVQQDLGETPAAAAVCVDPSPAASQLSAAGCQHATHWCRCLGFWWKE